MGNKWRVAFEAIGLTAVVGAYFANSDISAITAKESCAVIQ
ncbi:MAG: hypothetical protein ACI9A2_004349 [Halioglobus sp.]|jgi:hypothetical protein